MPMKIVVREVSQKPLRFVAEIQGIRGAAHQTAIEAVGSLILGYREKLGIWVDFPDLDDGEKSRVSSKGRVRR